MESSLEPSAGERRRRDNLTSWTYARLYYHGKEDIALFNSKIKGQLSCNSTAGSFEAASFCWTSPCCCPQRVAWELLGSSCTSHHGTLGIATPFITPKDRNIHESQTRPFGTYWKSQIRSFWWAHHKFRHRISLRRSDRPSTKRLGCTSQHLSHEPKRSIIISLVGKATQSIMWAKSLSLVVSARPSIRNSDVLLLSLTCRLVIFYAIAIIFSSGQYVAPA